MADTSTPVLPRGRWSISPRSVPAVLIRGNSGSALSLPVLLRAGDGLSACACVRSGAVVAASAALRMKWPLHFGPHVFVWDCRYVSRTHAAHEPKIGLAPSAQNDVRHALYGVRVHARVASRQAFVSAFIRENDLGKSLVWPRQRRFLSRVSDGNARIVFRKFIFPLAFLKSRAQAVNCQVLLRAGIEQSASTESVCGVSARFGGTRKGAKDGMQERTGRLGDVSQSLHGSWTLRKQPPRVQNAHKARGA